MVFVRTLPQYIVSIFHTVTGRSDTLSWTKLLEVTRLRETDFERKLALYFTEKNLVLSPYLIYIPVLNFLFLPKFLRPGTSQYVVAIGQ